MEGSCEQDNELSGSIKFLEIIEWLGDSPLLKGGLDFIELVAVLVYSNHRCRDMYHA
jgi:hypothetical protein